MAETGPIPRHQMTALDIEVAELERQEKAFDRVPLPQIIRYGLQAFGDAHPRLRDIAQGFPSAEAKARRNT